MVRVFNLSCLKGDIGLIVFTRVFLYSGPCIGLPSRRVVPSECQTPHDNIDMLLNGPLRLRGWVSRPPDIAPEVPTTDELLYLITEVVAIFYVTVVIPMESIVLHSILQLSGTLHMIGRPQQLLLDLKEDFYPCGV
ncbi:hypothetical protein BHM03_00017977 [Ensete ventricosum]|uniref:Uncharacterized protein n=1 Tax=Ensete ventricosum TaxID=4639 RepID=A0A445MF34_ENSVE|nr:hypothetical protein BHM03_00017977 [Ensete ventricosum]